MSGGLSDFHVIGNKTAIDFPSAEFGKSVDSRLAISKYASTNVWDIGDNTPHEDDNSTPGSIQIIGVTLENRYEHAV